MTAIFINHQQERCGVYQMGRRIGLTLEGAGVAQYLETWDLGTALAVARKVNPAAIIYNWHPSTLPWAPEVIRAFPSMKHIGLIHEISPDAPRMGSELFRHRIVCDPSFPVDNDSLFRSVRHIPRFDGEPVRNAIPTIGSFGFAVGGKQFATIAHVVAMELPGATLRLRIPRAFYGDDAGNIAASASDSARAVAAALGTVSVEVSHDFLGEVDLIRWLASNDLNVFFYDPNGGRGIASVLDYAIAARRPIAINESQMFRHVRAQLGCYPACSLRQSINSAEEVEALYHAWTPQRLVQDYTFMLEALGAA